jgi:hypothetical protein
MRTQEIPRNEWPEFFNSFTRRHEGWRVTLELFGPEIGDQIEGRDLAFEGITAEMADGGAKIEIMIGADPDDHITHVVTAPTQVSLEQTDEGADTALLIKSADNVSSLLRFPHGSAVGDG